MKRVLYCGSETDWDPSSFRELGDGLARDAQGVIHAGVRIPLDPATAQVQGWFLLDSAQVLGFGRSPMPQALQVHRESFQVLEGFEGRYASDREGLFYMSQRLAVSATARPRSMMVIEIAEDTHVFVSGLFDVVLSEPIHGKALLVADAFLVTEDVVVHQGQVLEGADPATFRLVGPLPQSEELMRFYRYSPGFAYAVDAGHVWHLGDRGLRPVAANPAGFEARGQWAWDDTQVFFAGGLVEGANPGSLEIIDDLWARDSQWVYFRQGRLEGADALSFEVLGSYLARDANGVFMARDPLPLSPASVALCCLGGGSLRGSHDVEYLTCEAILKDADAVWMIVNHDSDYTCGTYEQRLEGVDPASYQVADPHVGLARDKNGVWLADELIGGPDLELEQFEGGYWRLGDQWWFADCRLRQVRDGTPVGTFLVGETPEAGPVVPLGDSYLTDGLQVWHCGQVLDLEGTGAESLGSGFLRTRQGVFHWALVMTSRKVVTFESLGGALIDVDADTFEVLGDDYGADAQQVFHRSTITEIDRDSVKLLGGGWARDDQRVYCYGAPVDANPDRLQVLGGTRIKRYAGGDHGAWAADGNEVFRGPDRLQEAGYGFRDATPDPKTFEVLNARFARDSNHVYDLLHAGVLELDPSSVVASGGPWIRDASCVRWGRDLVKGAALETFQVVSNAYAIDATTVFAHGKATTIDRGSFRLVGDGWACDHTGVWFSDNQVDGADPNSIVVMRPLDPQDQLTQRGAPLQEMVQDDRGVYIWGRRLQAASRSSVALVGDHGHWRTQNHLFFEDRVVTTFEGEPEVLAPSIVRVDGAVYYEDVLVS